MSTTENTQKDQHLLDAFLAAARLCDHPDACVLETNPRHRYKTTRSEAIRPIMRHPIRLPPSAPRSLRLLLCALLFCGLLCTALAQEPARDRILFLHLRFKGDTLTLVRASVRPGKFKLRPHAQGDLKLNLLSDAGETLAGLAFADPLLERYEYEDPSHPGQILRKDVQRAEAEITLRLPYKAAGRRVTISRLSSAAAAPKVLATLELPAVEQP